MNTQYNPKDWLNDKQYAALLSLYNDFKEAFNQLPDYIQEAFYTRLESKTR